MNKKIYILFLLFVIYNIKFIYAKNHPKDLFVMKKLLDPTTLQINISGSRVFKTEYGKLTLIEASFFSTTWLDVDIISNVLVFIPDQIPDENIGKAAIILQSGTLNIDPEIKFKIEYGAKPALLFKIPILLFTNGIPVEKFGYKNESTLARDLRNEMMKDNDIKKEIAYPLAEMLIRAMTFMQNLDAAKNPNQFVTTGSSKRGITQWITAAVDKRVKGFMSNAYNAANLINFWKLIEEDFNGQCNLGNFQDTLSWLKTKVGQLYMNYYDPYTFIESINVPFVMNIGTNDHLFPIESANEFFPLLNHPKAFELIDNYPHGMGNKKHLANWRAIIHRTFFKRKTPIIEANILKQNSKEIIIRVKIKNNEKIKQVKIYYSKNNNKDFRNTSWDSKEMNNINYGIYETTLKKSHELYIAYYIELKDEKDNLTSFTSTQIEIINF